MAKAIYENYTEEELAHIISISTSWKDFARKQGYSNTPSGATLKALQKKATNYDTSHFSSVNKNKIERTPENTFIENSNASQRSLREMYRKNNYTEYVCSICGQEPTWQGKELTLILDHVNGINNDDRLENLRWVCPNCNQQLETTGSRNMNRSVFAKKYYCPDCGKEMCRGAIRCKECDTKKRIVPLEEMPVTREELKSLIRTKPFTEVGKIFGITDNGIRKWCDKFNLPRKVTDIKKYSDAEWASI